MSEVTRYMGWGNLGLVENVNGGLVKYSDYKALAAARDQYRDLSIKYGDKLSEALKERDAALAELAETRKEAGAEMFVMLTGELAKVRKELAALKGGQVRSACSKCNGTGSDGGHQHPDGQYEAYRCEECDGFGTAPPAPPAQASAWVPEGYALVPVELTEQMLDAAWNECSELGDDGINQVWRSMLAAAPTPGASDGKEGE